MRNIKASLAILGARRMDLAIIVMEKVQRIILKARLAVPYGSVGVAVWILQRRFLLNIRRGSKRPDSVSHDLGFRLARTR